MRWSGTTIMRPIEASWSTHPKITSDAPRSDSTTIRMSDTPAALLTQWPLG